jgi:hypothetical protein
MPLILSEAKEPRFELQLTKESEVKSFDAWALAGDIERLQAEKEQTLTPQNAMVAAMREATCLAELTPGQCMTVQAALIEFMEGLDVSKKLRARLPK